MSVSLSCLHCTVNCFCVSCQWVAANCQLFPIDNYYIVTHFFHGALVLIFMICFRASEADLIIMVVDLSAVTSTTPGSNEHDLENLMQQHLGDIAVNNLGDDSGQRLPEYHATDLTKNSPDIVLVLNKCDLLSKDKKASDIYSLRSSYSHRSVTPCILSCRTFEGFDEFIDILKQKVEDM